MKQKILNVFSLLVGLAKGCIFMQVISYIDFSVSSAINSLKILLFLCIIIIFISCIITCVALNKCKGVNDNAKK